MASNELSRSHRVLRIPELLDMIFGYLDPNSNAVNARVCRRWSDIALDTLWKEVDDLYRLFGLLAPLRVVGPELREEYEFERPPESADWRRFEKYANRVRRLKNYGIPPSGIVLKQSVFDDVARTRTRLNILPNMHTLCWNAPLDTCVMFMHGGVKTLYIFLPMEPQKPSPRPFFQEIAARMPNLTTLDVRSCVPMRDIETEMVELLRALPKLHKVTFPRYYFTTRIAQALSKQEHLGVIEFQYLPEQGFGCSLDVATFNPTLEEGAFPVLWDHSMAVGFDDAARFHNLPYAPANLTMLYIDSNVVERPSSVRNLLSVIAENCQLLQSLALVSVRDASLSYMEDNDFDPDFMISFDHLKPMLKIQGLTSMELVHQYPLSLDRSNIEQIASSWPSIETLILNNEPVYLEKSNLTLEALIPFARHCPKLSQLGLFIDADNIPDIPVDDHTSTSGGSVDYSSLPQFTSLRGLSMGISIISEEQFNRASLFLSHLLPLECRLNCGITWDEATDVIPAVTKAVQERCEIWIRVADLLPVLIRLRKEERERTRQLEDEVKDLRMRVSLMNEQAVLGVKMDVSTCIMI
ncbi:hypothetical protein CVT26_004591 [Gymnopilus dilepis]|uniref:F-box domain-containing protein n=1 Tax=Gymnopilus dilepis TaxID=231916 RepID=A0A409WC36_9AGAR|nr:hypothetical protein CVT26_004591 [Gymnopilus dilepis]